jgi:predicted RNA-binding protein YlxR (DUF448 family)
MPRRRCVGCGRIAPKSELLRIALADHGDAPRRAVPDRDGVMPGRGAYLCWEPLSGQPATACLARAGRRGGIARALRAGVRIDTELIESMGS